MSELTVLRFPSGEREYRLSEHAQLVVGQTIFRSGLLWLVVAVDVVAGQATVWVTPIDDR